MTAIRDPYPKSLDDIPFTPTENTLEPLVPDGQVKALNRIGLALEQLTVLLADRLQNAPQAPTGGFVAPASSVAPLAALPPVQTVQAKPPCPFHGPDKVAVSTNGKGGFYCQAKAGPGQPSNPKGYCTWHS
jgi:hypothetical protein